MAWRRSACGSAESAQVALLAPFCNVCSGVSPVSPDRTPLFLYGFRHLHKTSVQTEVWGALQGCGSRLCVGYNAVDPHQQVPWLQKFLLTVKTLHLKQLSFCTYLPSESESLILMQWSQKFWKMICMLWLLENWLLIQSVFCKSLKTHFSGLWITLLSTMFILLLLLYFPLHLTFFK